MMLHNEPMHKHCSLRAGGMVDNFFIPDTLQALSDFLQNNQQPILMVGLGSNLLVRDTGFKGTAIKLTHFNQLEFKDDIVHTGAGTTLAKLSRFCESHSLNGAEFLSAIPGNVGGALAMNAGAFDSEMWSAVASVTTINHLGEIFTRDKSEFDIAYRCVVPHQPNEIFIGANLQFLQTEKQDNIKALLKKRNDAQPIGLPNCGSVFKNPQGHNQGHYAAKLIEDSNLKGFCVGGACVSNKHANFIINQNNATATEIENLIQHIQHTVQSKFNIDLEVELIIKQN